jgi:hypothetical protein
MMPRRMKRDDITAHGFRSTFSDWASEVSSFSGEVRETGLAHTIQNKAERDHRRADALEKRRGGLCSICAFRIPNRGHRLGQSTLKGRYRTAETAIPAKYFTFPLASDQVALGLCETELWTSLMAEEPKAPIEQQEFESSAKRNRVERNRRAQERAKYDIEGELRITNNIDENQSQKIVDTIKLLNLHVPGGNEDDFVRQVKLVLALFIEMRQADPANLMNTEKFVNKISDELKRLVETLERISREII